MRSADSYRAARRNAMRANGEIRFWKNAPNIHKANEAAKIKQRYEQAKAAQAMIADIMAQLGQRVVFVLGRNWQADALRKFWLTQPVSRVRSRILRELAVR